MNQQRPDERVTLHEIGGSTFSVGSVKRWLALVGGLVILGLLAGVLVVISLAISTTGDGADPDEAFSPTELDVTALRAEITWTDDADDLDRLMEPSTREQLGIAWLRADNALERAAVGDTSGLDVWFVDAALANAEARFGAETPTGPSVTTTQAVAHRLTVEFYSLDGAVVVLGADTIRERPTGPSPTRADTVEVLERLQAIFVLSDGNWRIRHFERLTDTDLAVLIET